MQIAEALAKASDKEANKSSWLSLHFPSNPRQTLRQQQEERKNSNFN